LLEGDVYRLYSKERQYQKKVFGNYEMNPTLNLGSFLVFLQDYVNRAVRSYTQKWSRELPEWLVDCREHEQQGTAPIKAYEELVEIHALSGAALEAFATINPDKWRKDSKEES